jgi:hypothetical protein
MTAGQQHRCRPLQAAIATMAVRYSPPASIHGFQSCNFGCAVAFFAQTFQSLPTARQHTSRRRIRARHWKDRARRWKNRSTIAPRTGVINVRMKNHRTNKKVWLITGAARGLGADISRAALAAGHAVVATGRDAERVSSALGNWGDPFSCSRAHSNVERAETQRQTVSTTNKSHLCALRPPLCLCGESLFGTRQLSW